VAWCTSFPVLRFVGSAAVVSVSVAVIQAGSECPYAAWIWCEVMSIQVTGIWWSGLTRALAVLGVVAGVFAMHGLSGNHDVTMVGQQMSARSGAEADLASDHPMARLGEVTSSAIPGMALDATASVIAAAARDAVVSVDEHQHSMAGACLAMLNGLVLLLALALGLRSLLAWRAVEFAASAGRSVLTGRSPPWLVPSLSKLCVLRT
jgi:hypothetical protein